MSPFIRPILLTGERVCYLENAKCGSSSILDALGRERARGGATDRRGARIGLLRSSRAIDARTLPALIKSRLVSATENGFIFSFVRNPYVRLLSAYLDLIDDPSRFPLQRMEAFGSRSNVAFEEFVDLVARQGTREMNFHWRPQADLLDPENIPYDFIGRVERFDDDLALMGIDERTGENNGRGQEHQTGASALVRRYYTETSARRVYERYRADFDWFGYSPELGRVDSFDDRSLPRGPARAIHGPTRSVGWCGAIAAARAVNLVQRSPLWNLAWMGRRAVARIRALR